MEQIGAIIKATTPVPPTSPAQSTPSRTPTIPRGSPSQAALGYDCPRTGPHWITLDVPVGHPLFGETFLCPRCTPPPSRRLDTFDAHSATLRTALDAANSWPSMHPWLVFSGGPGTGKTHLLEGLTWKLTMGLRHWRALTASYGWDVATRAWDMAGASRLEYDRSLYELWVAPHLLIDDLGVGRKTSDAEWDMWDDILDRRYRPLVLPTIITTNMTAALFARQLPRIASRLSEVGMWCPTGSEDYRPRTRLAERGI